MGRVVPSILMPEEAGWVWAVKEVQICTDQKSIKPVVSTSSYCVVRCHAGRCTVSQGQAHTMLF